MNIKLKEFIRSLVKYTSEYKSTRLSLEGQFTMEKLRAAVERAIEDVPYYRDNGYKAMMTAGNEFDITAFPILHKTDVIGKEEQFVSERFWKFLLRKEKTGGTTGSPMRLFYSPTLSIQRTAMPDILFERFAPRNTQIAMLRGIRPKDGALWQRIGQYRIALSSYHINENNIDEYLDIIRRENVQVMTAFPSSLVVLASHIRDKYGTCPALPLKALICSSEIFDRQSKELVMSVFPGVDVVDFYCMSEFVTAAYSIGLGSYEFNNNYGYVEFVDTGDRTPAGNRISEIVATSVMNDTMPLIRYATADYVELDEAGNVLNIIGRSSDYVVNKDGKLAPCIVVFNKKAMLKVGKFQYYQDTVGKVEFHVIPKGEDYTEQDRLVMKQNMEQAFGDAVECDVRIVDEIEYTRAGKVRRMVQRLDLSQYKK